MMYARIVRACVVTVSEYKGCSESNASCSGSAYSCQHARMAASLPHQLGEHNPKCAPITQQQLKHTGALLTLLSAEIRMHTLLFQHDIAD